MSESTRQLDKRKHDFDREFWPKIRTLVESYRAEVEHAVRQGEPTPDTERTIAAIFATAMQPVAERWWDAERRAQDGHRFFTSFLELTQRVRGFRLLRWREHYTIDTCWQHNESPLGNHAAEGRTLSDVLAEAVKILQAPDRPDAEDEDLATGGPRLPLEPMRPLAGHLLDPALDTTAIDLDVARLSRRGIEKEGQNAPLDKPTTAP